MNWILIVFGFVVLISIVAILWQPIKTFFFKIKEALRNNVQSNSQRTQKNSPAQQTTLSLTRGNMDTTKRPPNRQIETQYYVNDNSGNQTTFIKKNIAGDGNCLFTAIAHQIIYNGLEEKVEMKIKEISETDKYKLSLQELKNKKKEKFEDEKVKTEKNQKLLEQYLNRQLTTSELKTSARDQKSQDEIIRDKLALELRAVVCTLISAGDKQFINCLKRILSDNNAKNNDKINNISSSCEYQKYGGLFDIIVLSDFLRQRICVYQMEHESDQLTLVSDSSVFLTNLCERSTENIPVEPFYLLRTGEVSNGHYDSLIKK